MYNYLIKKILHIRLMGWFFNLLVMCYFKNTKDLHFNGMSCSRLFDKYKTIINNQLI